MTLEEALENDIIESGDLIAFSGKDWKKRFEKVEYKNYIYFSDVALAFVKDKEAFMYFYLPKSGLQLVPLEGLDSFLLIKTGITWNKTIQAVMKSLIGTKKSHINEFLSFFSKNTTEKRFYPALLAGLILIYGGYRIVLDGITPTRMINSLTHILGRKSIYIKKQEG